MLIVSERFLLRIRIPKAWLKEYPHLCQRLWCTLNKIYFSIKQFFYPRLPRPQKYLHQIPPRSGLGLQTVRKLPYLCFHSFHQYPRKSHFFLDFILAENDFFLNPFLSEDVCGCLMSWVFSFAENEAPKIHRGPQAAYISEPGATSGAVFSPYESHLRSDDQKH